MIRTVDLALQGGGAHGAFTWGVLDRLLEDERIEIRGVSGASAGAMNAVVLANGLLEGGRPGAQSALWGFWKHVSRSTRRPFNPGPAEFVFGEWTPAHPPLFGVYEWFSRFASPYQFNPFNLNPLKDILEDAVDFERLRRTEDLKLFISATNVRTGRLKVFRNPELSSDTVMASACLPMLFQAVELESEAYWDGGYAGNPALLPLIAESTPRDLLLVQINPSKRQEIPRTPRAILNRLNEITFNASLIKEMRAVAVFKQLLEAERTPPSRFRQQLFDQVRRLLVHRIHAEEELSDLGVESKLNPQWEALIRLHGIGRTAADQWLARNFDALGERSTVDLTESFL